MTLEKVPTVRTSFSVEDLTKSLIKAWYNIYNNYPEKDNIAVIISQWSLETGVGKECWNYNIGNIKAKDDPNTVIKYCALNGVWEVENGKKVLIPESSPSAWFRAFDNLDDGVLFYINFLKNNRYKKAWTAVESGDPETFAQLLKCAEYYTAPESQYAAGLEAYFNKFMKDQMFDNILENIQKETALPSDNNTSTVPPQPPVNINIIQQEIINNTQEINLQNSNNITQIVNIIGNIINFFSKLFKK
jgi:hypothetical protein